MSNTINPLIFFTRRQMTRPHEKTYSVSISFKPPFVSLREINYMAITWSLVAMYLHYTTSKLFNTWTLLPDDRSSPPEAVSNSQRSQQVQISSPRISAYLSFSSHWRDTDESDWSENAPLPALSTTSFSQDEWLSWKYLFTDYRMDNDLIRRLTFKHWKRWCDF